MASCAGAVHAGRSEGFAEIGQREQDIPSLQKSLAWSRAGGQGSAVAGCSSAGTEGLPARPHWPGVNLKATKQTHRL